MLLKFFRTSHLQMTNGLEPLFWQTKGNTKRCRLNPPYFGLNASSKIQFLNGLYVEESSRRASELQQQMPFCLASIASFCPINHVYEQCCNFLYQYHDQNLDKQLLNAQKCSKIVSERKLGTEVFSIPTHGPLLLDGRLLFTLCLWWPSFGYFTTTRKYGRLRQPIYSPFGYRRVQELFRMKNI